MKPAFLLLPLTLMATPVLAQGTAPQAAQAPVVAAPATSATPEATTAPQAPKPSHVAQGVENHLKNLETQLKITPQEQGVWTDFANTMRENALRTDELLQKQLPPEQQTALESVQTYTRITQARAEDAQRLLPKFEALYAALSPEQKKAADETFAHVRRTMMEHHAGPKHDGKAG